jgi:methylglutaconyl-CoA hydratase
MSEDRGSIRTALDGPVARVVLSRPDRRNAFGPAMIAALTEAFVALGRDDEARVVVLSGEGPVFSAGADLEYMRAIAELDQRANVADALRLADLFSAVRDCPKPVVARVQGAAVGGGVGLVAAADIAVAADTTRFAFSEARLGIAPAVIAPYVLPRIGVTAARELFLTGEMFGAERARAVGLVSQVVPEGELDAAIADRVGELLRASPSAQAAIKRMIVHVDRHGDAAREDMARLIADLRASADGRAGLSAFLERRPPPWDAGGPSRR